jgi:hypothetical protein
VPGLRGTSKKKEAQKGHTKNPLRVGWLCEEREAEMPRGPTTSPKTKRAKQKLTTQM